MSEGVPIRVGLMGFGRIGRQIFELAERSADFEIVAIADIGKPEILHYLLEAEVGSSRQFELQGNFLAGARCRARLMQVDRPVEMPWDIFGVDIVIDATGKFRDRASMEAHLANGAPRVLLRSLPQDGIDRLVIPGVNDATAQAGDRMISAGSPTTAALCLLLHSLAARFTIECGSMTSVHSYTSDQPLQDYAGSDFRRSRSAASNIIPNSHEAALWLPRVLPGFDRKFMTWALNVPVQVGSLLDVTLVMSDPAVAAEDINAAMRDAASRHPGVIGVAEDPIVSSDVIGSEHSLLFDARGTLKAGSHIIKTLGWYETRGHASRLLDVARLYAQLDRSGRSA
jgi:glyceraldehyde 3-phosphate dehydrogenase